MNLNQLHYFVTLAYMEHYTKAAKQLSITQPSLSHAIGMLEQELGTYLFEKQGRNVVLTKYGKVFLKYAEESLRVLDTGIKKTRSMTSETSGEIDIGYIYTQGSEFIPELVKNFLNENKEKDIQFHFNNGVTEEIVKGIKSERFDLGFCSYMKNEPDIEFIPVTKEELAAIVPYGHPLADRESVKFEEIASYPQIFFNKTSGLRAVIDGLFKDADITPDIKYTVDEDSALAGLVAKGFGVGIVPNIPILKSLQVKIIPIEKLAYRRYIYMAIMRNKYLSPIVKQFLQYVQKNYKIEIEQ